GWSWQASFGCNLPMLGASGLLRFAVTVIIIAARFFSDDKGWNVAPVAAPAVLPLRSALQCPACPMASRPGCAACIFRIRISADCLVKRAGLPCAQPLVLTRAFAGRVWRVAFGCAA